MAHVVLQTEPIDYAPLVEAARRADCGAVVLFLGTVRDHSDGRPVAGLHYAAYPAMAERQLRAVCAEAEGRWPLGALAVVHRHGELGLADVAVAVVAASAHRAAAFEAARWVMDTVKERVPIWKQERWADGPAEWVHPGWPAGGNP